MRGSEDLKGVMRLVITELLCENKMIQYHQIANHDRIAELRYGDNKMRQVLEELVSEGFIKVLIKPSGRRPASYSYPDYDPDLELSVPSFDSDDGITLEVKLSKKVVAFRADLHRIESKIKEVQDKIDSLLREKKLLEAEKRVTEFSLRSLQEIHELYKVTKVDLGQDYSKNSHEDTLDGS